MTDGPAAASRSARPESTDIVSLAERMGYMQALRIGIAGIVLLAGSFLERVIGASLADLVFITAGYIGISALAEASRRTIGRALTVVTLMLFIDGLYLAWVVYSTGGMLSPLRFLFYVHLIAVTLLASHRTGLKIAMWDSLLFLVVFYAQAAGILEVREGIANALPGEGSLFTQTASLNIGALWAVAIGTASFSRLNERELRRRKWELEALTRMARDLETVLEPAQIAETLLDAVTETFDVKRALVLGGHEGELELLGFRGPGEPTEISTGADPIVEQAFEEHGTQLVKSLDPERDKRLVALLPFARNLMVIPLFAEGVPLGALVLEYSRSATKIEKRVLSIMGQFAAHAALALNNAWLQEQVQKMAETDALTGSANRRVFDETLARELSRAARTGEPLTLAMFDVDRFKKFNDTYGHQAGDEVLKGVAHALQKACRDFDVVARYGGEEFAVILPGLTSKESLSVVERLRKSISDVEAVAPITASAGVATFPNHAADAVSLVKNADEALYESKRSGRDRVTRSRRRATFKAPAAGPPKPSSTKVAASE